MLQLEQFLQEQPFGLNRYRVRTSTNCNKGKTLGYHCAAYSANIPRRTDTDTEPTSSGEYPLGFPLPRLPSNPTSDASSPSPSVACSGSTTVHLLPKRNNHLVHLATMLNTVLAQVVITTHNHLHSYYMPLNIEMDNAIRVAR